MSKLKVKIGSGTSALVNSSPPPAEVPGQAWPFDLQCVLRLPVDVAEKIAPLLKHGNTGSLLQIIPLSSEPKGRNFRVKVLDELFVGTLVDLPTYLETHKIGDGGVVYKSADVCQILVVSRGEIEANFVSSSGLTPPTAWIANRRFRPPPAADLSKAESAVSSIIGGGTLEWEEEADVLVTERDDRMRFEPGSVWEPTEDILEELYNAGMIDENGEPIGDDEVEDGEDAWNEAEGVGNSVRSGGIAIKRTDGGIKIKRSGR